MFDYEKISALAKESGFTNYGYLDVSTLEFLQDVRDMCNPSQCPRFNHSWACPPACGTLEEMRERVKSYTHGILVQTVGELEDSYDWEGIQATAKSQSASFQKLWDKLEEEYPNLFAMGTGGCSKCEKCTYPDDPCRFPKRMAPSMEACGLYVSKVCTDNNLAYNYGPNKIAYSACFLLA